MICLAYSSLQTDSWWWGADSLTWRPSRFIKKADSSVPQGKADLDTEQFAQPRRGSFIGWSEGTRDCPGRKFSQVEFVATIASIFRDWRVNPVVFDGETIEGARKRVLDLIEKESAMVFFDSDGAPGKGAFGLVEEGSVALVFLRYRCKYHLC
jgi:hypothetical protein